jgi:hypothetical protein
MAGKYFDYPSASLNIDSDDIAKPILLFQAARAAKLKREAEARQQMEIERHNLESEATQNRYAATQEQRAIESHRAALENERLKGEEFRRKQAMDLATGLPKVSESLNPASPRYNPGVGNALASALGVQGLRQVTPDQPQVPSLANPPERLRQVLSRGTQLAEIEGAGSEVGGSLPGFDRPPSEAEFQRYAGRPGQGPLGPEQYGESGEEGPLARGESRDDLMAQGRARQAFRNPEYVGAAGDYLQQRQAALGEQATYQQRLAESQRNPRYEGTSQFGPISLAPVEQEEGINRQHNEAADRINQLASQEGVDPYTANEIRLVARKVAMRMVTPEEANKDLNFLLSQRLGVDKARLQAEGQARKGNSFDQTNAIRAETLFTSQFNQLMTNFGFKGDVMKLKDLVDTRSQLRKDNAALDTQAGANFAKQANGAGVLTDADFQRFWGMVGGLGANPYTDWNSFIEHIWSGKIPAEKRKLVIAAIEERMNESVNRLQFAKERADAWAEKQPPEKQQWYAPLRAGHLGWLPDKQQAGQKTTPQSQAAGAAKTNARDQEAFRKYQAEGSKLPPEVKAKLEAKFKALGLMK